MLSRLKNTNDVKGYLLSKDNRRAMAKRESASTKGVICLSISLSSSNQR